MSRLTLLIRNHTDWKQAFFEEVVVRDLAVVDVRDAERSKRSSRHRHLPGLRSLENEVSA
ncbi:MAG: hypothetical protein ACREA0_00320 [bacterium]